MKLTKYSEHRLMGSMHQWGVCKDFAEPMYNYLVYGFGPGSFFTGWYAGDANAIIHSHPGNSVEALKNLTKWMLNCMPPASKGSYQKVDAWTKMPEEQRRKILEDWDLVYTEQDEIIMTLKSTPMEVPFFWD